MNAPLLYDHTGREVARVEARYDAADPWQNWGARAYIWKGPANAQEEIPAHARTELCKLSRHLADNSPMISGLFERIIGYVNGNGLIPFSRSKDKTWAAEANAKWAAFAAEPDIRSDDDWCDLCDQLLRAEMKDGDSGLILTTDDEGAPKVCAVEGNDIGSDGASSPDNEFDGIITGKFGKPSGYRVAGAGVVDAKSFVHYLNRLRPGMVRGVPLLSSALYTGHDVNEILNLEKLAVKELSTHVDIIKTQTGEVKAAGLKARRFQRADVAGNTVDRVAHYREQFGPTSKVIMRDDEWEAFQHDRPSPAWQGFIDFLSQTLCIAAKIPPSVLLQIKVGGADTRRDLAAADRTFQREQRRLCRKHERVWRFVIESDPDLMRSAPDDWKAVAWQGPKSITVDAGRESQQDREDVKMGLLTREEYWSRYGLDPDEQDQKVINEAIKRREALKAASFTLEEFRQIISLEPAAPQQIQQTNDQTP